MTISPAEVDAFFKSYGKALGSRDVKAIAEHWAAPGLVLSDDGAIPVARTAEVQEFFGGAMGQYHKVSSAQATIRSALALSAEVAGCEIAWEHRDKTGRPIGGEEGFYVLKRSDGRLRIHFYTPKMG